MSPASAARCAIVFLLAALVSCTPWRSDIELTPEIAAAPVLEVRGRQVGVLARPRRTEFGPWVATRGGDPRGFDWAMTLLRDSAVVGSGRCWSVFGGGPRPKSRWQDAPGEVFSCELVLAAGPDTVWLEVKSEAGRPLTGRARGVDWDIVMRGTDRLRTRSCLMVITCGWYLSLDGTDVAAVEADARAWVFLSGDLGSEGRDLVALIAAALLLRNDAAAGRPGTPQQPGP